MKSYDKVEVIKGIGEKTNNLLSKLEIDTVMDLLEHYPRNYDEYKEPREIEDIKEGEIVAISGTIVKTPTIKKVRNLQIINTQVRDTSGVMILTWFNMSFLQRTLKTAYSYVFRGSVSRKNGVLVMEQPQIFSKLEYYQRMNQLKPIYPLTAGLSNNMLGKFIKIALDEIDDIEDYLPRSIQKKYELIHRTKAIKEIHFPKNREILIRARERLVFDEFLLYILAIKRLKNNKNNVTNQYIMNDFKIASRIIEALPYTLTHAQLRVWDEIKQDLSSNYIMNRLIQGDVGSGKTIIAALALATFAVKGYQASMMVPTEVLAKQHYESLTNLLSEFNVKICLLVGSMTAKEKREAYAKIKEKEVDIIVGTHALIQEKVEYNNLALVITDEQHRFGVNQRQILSEKGKDPHILVMSATPIPRTLAIILYGDLDISIIDELPANRLPIKNAVVNTNYHVALYKFLSEQIGQGRQAYVICPMVEESENLEVENVINYSEVLKSNLSKEIVVEYLHGKMKAVQKNDIMDRFSTGNIDILVSTTVVEVGVNVPNATVMVVENAERFGLSQLHQLRGRVGRGEHQSYCIFFCGSESKDVRRRLELLKESNDGFYIASEDLKLRGPGDLFGIIQSGDLVFKIGDIFNDASILQKASELAKNLNDDELEEIFEKHQDYDRKVLKKINIL